MSQSRRVLIVAYYFPPIGGIGSIRLARFADLLPDQGWDTKVLAPRATPHAADPHLGFPEERVVRSRSLELTRGTRAAPRTAAGGASSDAGSRPALGALKVMIRRYGLFPDPQIGWYPGAVSAGLSLLRRERFDAIYSSAYPVTAHLVARTLSRHARVPWIAEFRDPWSDRVFRDHPYARPARALERSIAREATGVVMTSPTWAADYGARWETQIAVLPNGHDLRLPERRPPDRPILAYLGSYYPGDQDLTTLWRALAVLRARDGATMPRIRFIGRAPAQLQDEVAAFGLGDVLESTGFLPHDDAMMALMSASMVVASGLARDNPASRGCIPGKLFEYLASGLPVVLVDDADTDAARLIAGRPGCHVVAPGDVDGAVQALRTGLASGDCPRDVADLSREARTRSLAAILDGAACSGPV